MGTIEIWLTLTLVGLPILGWLLWWLNEIWYVLPFKIFGRRAKLPPGHMGFPFIGELLTFLWYFKILRRPDDFINSKRLKYGDGVGMYRTHLFGSPSIIACFPTINKFVLQSESLFITKWPSIDIIGRYSLASVQGKTHDRIRNYLITVINRPDAMRRIVLQIQPRIVVALQSWENKGKIKAYDEIKKVIFENIGKLFVSMEPGPVLDSMNKLFEGMLKGMRAQPINLPGTAYRHALMCRKELDDIFRIVMEKRKKHHDHEKDLMDGLMQMKDEQGNKLSDDEVVDNIVGLVLAGYESTTLALTWMIYYLAKDPSILQKLREESMGLNKNGEYLTSEDISKMKYTSKVIEEAVRLANVSSLTFRLVLKEVEYKGYTIPKDWKVITWLRYSHTNPNYFENPLCFNPDRWNEPVTPGAYQAFGSGPRKCPGNTFARTSMCSFLHHLVIGYKWELVNSNAGVSYLPYPKPVDGAEITFHKL